MALSRIWVSMICVALAFGAASGRGAQLGAAAAQGVQQAVDFCLTVGGMICLWSGVMELVRPISGSGALAAASDIIQTYGADSRIGRTAAVMLGSTETTFYVLAVYFGACGIRHSRWAIPAAIVADVTGFVTAAALVRCLWGT